jgi:hypothetical protein
VTIFPFPAISSPGRSPDSAQFVQEISSVRFTRREAGAGVRRRKAPATAAAVKPGTWQRKAPAAAVAQLDGGRRGNIQSQVCSLSRVLI